MILITVLNANPKLQLTLVLSPTIYLRDYWALRCGGSQCLHAEVTSCMMMCTVTWRRGSRSYVGAAPRWRSCWHGNRSWMRRRRRLRDSRRRQCKEWRRDERHLWMILSCQVSTVQLTSLFINVRVIILAKMQEFLQGNCTASSVAHLQ